MKLRNLLIGVALTALAGPAFAQDKTVTLKLSHWVPATHPLQKAMEEWGASVEKASGGTIKYQVYPAQQLGKAQDHYDMTRDGIVEMSYINPGFQPGRFPIVSAYELPFLVGEFEGRHSRLRHLVSQIRRDRDEGREILLRIHSRSGAICICVQRRSWCRPTCKGLKVRPSQATFAAWVTLLGGTNVQSGPSEAADLLSKGVADALTFPWGSVTLLGADKVTKYHLDIPLATATFQWIMN